MGFKSHGSLRTELSVEGQAVSGLQHGTLQLSDRKKFEILSLSVLRASDCDTTIRKEGKNKLLGHLPYGGCPKALFFWWI